MTNVQISAQISYLGHETQDKFDKEQDGIGENGILEMKLFSISVNGKKKQIGKFRFYRYLKNTRQNNAIIETNDIKTFDPYNVDVNFPGSWRIEVFEKHWCAGAFSVEIKYGNKTEKCILHTISTGTGKYRIKVIEEIGTWEKGYWGGFPFGGTIY